MKRLFSCRALWIGLTLSSVVSCGQQPIIVPGRTLDRPSDMAFLCMVVKGQGEGAVVSAQPPGTCEANPTPPPKGLRTSANLALVTNSAKGELAAVDFDTNRMIDLDEAIPGYNMLPVGQLPESIAVSSDGCKALTANRGSCDISVIDTSRLLAGVLGSAPPATGAGAVTNTLVVSTDAGPLRARPGQVAFLPGPTQGIKGYQCGLQGGFGGAIGEQIQNVPWRAVITYPSCGLVALVDVPSGRLIDSVYVRTDGVVPAGTTPICPAECGAPDMGAPALADASAPANGPPDAAVNVGDAGEADGGAGPADPTLVTVGTLAFTPYAAGTQPLHVAGGNAGLVVPLAVVGGERLISTRPALRLAGAVTGISRLRAVVNPYAPNGSEYFAEVGAFLYAVADDGTVRVVSVEGNEVECDANVDTRILEITLPLIRNCYPVSANLARRFGARGPGIQVPPVVSGPGLPAPAPVDVTFLKAQVPGGPPVAPFPRIYNGVYAYVLLSNGDVLVVDLASSLTLSNVPLSPGGLPVVPAAHSVRNAFNFMSITEGGGPPRVVGTPTTTLTTNDLPFSLRPVLPRPLYPRIEGFPNTQTPECSPLAGPGSPQTIYACFDRPAETVGQTWAIVWEGALPGTVRTTGRLVSAPEQNSPAVWQDAGANFCSSGVQVGDVLAFAGCAKDLDCGSIDEFQCVPSAAGTSGLCARRNVSTRMFQERCQPLLQSRRRYEVQVAGPQQLTLGPLLEELPRPTTRPCVMDADCDIAGAPQTNGLKCQAPTAGQGLRCVRPCSDQDPCRVGFACQAYDAGSYCVEAPPADAFCLAETRAYRVQAGKAFLVAGSFSASFPTATAVNGRCEPLASRDQRQANRIPLAAATCTIEALVQPPELIPPNQQQSQRPLLSPPKTAMGWSNPCLFEGPNADAVGADAAAIHTKALFETPDVRFILTNLEQPFGDGATISFAVRGGFAADSIVTRSTAPEIAVPRRLLTGPGLVPTKKDDPPGQLAVYPYVYMIDSGRLGALHRGQILRIDTRRPGFDTARSTPPFQIQ